MFLIFIGRDSLLGRSTSEAACRRNSRVLEAGTCEVEVRVLGQGGQVNRTEGGLSELSDTKTV